MKLTDIKCKNAKPMDPPSKAPRKLADGNGLYLWLYLKSNAIKRSAVFTTNAVLFLPELH